MVELKAKIKDYIYQCYSNPSLTLVWLVASGVGGRVRLYSESQVHTLSRWEDAELQDGISAEESGGASDGAPFRGRSQSAPAALWKAKKYGRQLRRMSDEFDTWLDRGVSFNTNHEKGY